MCMKPRIQFKRKKSLNILLFLLLPSSTKFPTLTQQLVRVPLKKFHQANQGKFSNEVMQTWGPLTSPNHSFVKMFVYCQVPLEPCMGTLCKRPPSKFRVQPFGLPWQKTIALLYSFGSFSNFVFSIVTMVKQL